MRVIPQVSRAVSIEMGPPARPVTVTNMLQRYRQAMRYEFNPLIRAELALLMRGPWDDVWTWTSRHVTFIRGIRRWCP